ncbi:MAG: threonine/serine exporter family protein, partial [Micrococcales bacterium]|nr:threonine/serine exporter family protein [Micrococcales bacterium]
MPALPQRRRKPANRVAPTALASTPLTAPLTAPLTTVSAGTTEQGTVGPEVMAKTPKLSWRDRAQRAVVAGSAPTWSLDLRAIADGVEVKRSRAVIDLAMRVAEALLSTGAPAADVTATVLRLTDAYGLRSVHVDVTFASIAVSHHRGADDPVTIIRTVRVRSADYARLARLQELVTSLEADPGDIAQARERFDVIAGMPHPYRRSVVTVATALLGLGVCVLLDGSFAEVVISLFNAIIVDRVQLWLARHRLPAFFSQMVGGAIPTVGAILLIWARTNNVPGLANVSASAVVATGIVVLLAGLSVVGAAQDAIDGYYVTAGARTFEVFVLTFGIIVGVLIVLTVSQAVGAPTYLAPYSRLTGDF